MANAGRGTMDSDKTDGTTWDRWPIRQTWLIFALMATMIGFSVAPLVNDAVGRLNKDYVLWFYTGRAVARGLSVYPLDGRVFPFMYPPSAAALLAILSSLGSKLFLLALLTVHSVAWVANILLSLYLVSGRVARHRPVLYLVPSLGVAAYIHDAYLLGQPNMTLLAMMLGALACLGARRAVAGGGLIALAAAVKAFPFLGIGYLIYRRLWKATAAMLVALTLLMVVLPMPFRGVTGAYTDAGTWTMGMVLRYDSGSIAQRPERGFGHKNQSLMALANRLLRDIPADGEAHDGWKVNIASLGFGAVNRIILAAAIVLGGLYVGLMSWKMPRPGPILATEGALLILLILVFSPLSFNYSYVWLLYPLTVALYFGTEAAPRSAERRVMVGAVAGSLGLLALSLVSARTAAGYGNSFWAAIALFAALAWKLAVDPAVGSPVQQVAAWVARPGRKRLARAISTSAGSPARPSGPHRSPIEGRTGVAKVSGASARVWRSGISTVVNLTVASAVGPLKTDRSSGLSSQVSGAFPLNLAA